MLSAIEAAEVADGETILSPGGGELPNEPLEEEAGITSGIRNPLSPVEFAADADVAADTDSSESREA
jgi:hypothetical protein